MKRVEGMGVNRKRGKGRGKDGGMGGEDGGEERVING